VQFPTDSGTTDIFVLFDNEYAQAGLGQESCVGQAVVSGANDNGVIVVHRSVFPDSWLLGWSDSNVIGFLQRLLRLFHVL
jgi:hypothetical protein